MSSNKVLTLDLMVEHKSPEGGWVHGRKSYDIREGYNISLSTSPEGYPIIGLSPAKIKKRKK